MALVYLAHDTQLDRKVALKVPLFLDDSDERIARFAREARTAAHLHHPNICPVFDVGSQDGVQFLTMAYVEGETLGALLKRTGPLPAPQAVEILRKLAGALQEAHDAGVIHRDLKPSNVMIDKRGEPIVMDFGVARRTGDEVGLTRSGAPLGTPAYMPPEQVTGDCHAHGPQSDIYSLGVIMYELLTGRLPFCGDLASVANKILSTPPPPLRTHRPELSPALEAVCLKAMAKVPTDRFPTARAFANGLAAALEGTAAIAAETGDSAEHGDRRESGSRRGPLWFVVAGAVAVAAVAVVIGTSMFPATDDAQLVRNDTPVPVQPVDSLPVAEPFLLTQSPEPAGGATAPPLLEIYVQRAAQSTDYQLLTTASLPLRDRDKVQLKISVEQPAYLYLFWYDAEGRAKRLFPKDPIRQERATEHTDPPTEPNDSDLASWHVIGGKRGVEMALAATADAPLSAAQIQELESTRVVYIDRGPGAFLEMVAAERGLVAQEKATKGRLHELSREDVLPLFVPPESHRRLVTLDGTRREDLDSGRGLVGRTQSIKGRRVLVRDFEQHLRAEGLARYVACVFPHE
jgi:serine/threonine protein kinase